MKKLVLFLLIVSLFLIASGCRCSVNISNKPAEDDKVKSERETLSESDEASGESLIDTEDAPDNDEKADGITGSSEDNGNAIDVVVDTDTAADGAAKENGETGQESADSGSGNTTSTERNGETSGTGDVVGGTSSPEGAAQNTSGSETEPQGMQIDGGFEIEIPSGGGDAGM